jgi:hypothetical protein
VDDFNPYLPGTALLVSCPAVALAPAVGGGDLPVIGLMCLGLALAGRPGGAVGAVRRWGPRRR